MTLPKGWWSKALQWRRFNQSTARSSGAEAPGHWICSQKVEFDALNLLEVLETGTVHKCTRILSNYCYRLRNWAEWGRYSIIFNSMTLSCRSRKSWNLLSEQHLFDYPPVPSRQTLHFDHWCGSLVLAFTKACHASWCITESRLNHSATSDANGQNPKIPHDIVKIPGKFDNTTVINAAMLSTHHALHEKPNTVNAKSVLHVLYNWLKLQDLDFNSDHVGINKNKQVTFDNGATTSHGTWPGCVGPMHCGPRPGTLWPKSWLISPKCGKRMQKTIKCHWSCCLCSPDQEPLWQGCWAAGLNTCQSSTAAFLLRSHLLPHG